MKKHLAIFKSKAGEDILCGVKTIETRFSRMKIAPYGVISTGDLVYIKPTGQEIIGEFRVKKVIFFDGLDSEGMNKIQNEYGSKIAADSAYWQRKANSTYGSLIFIGQTTPFITAPLKVVKKDLRGWVVLD